jgi:hypothetical protein
MYQAAELSAQKLVTQRTENPRVGGSNPPLGTIKIQQNQIHIRIRTRTVFAPYDVRAITNHQSFQGVME